MSTCVRCGCEGLTHDRDDCISALKAKLVEVEAADARTAELLAKQHASAIAMQVRAEKAEMMLQATAGALSEANAQRVECERSRDAAEDRGNEHGIELMQGKVDVLRLALIALLYEVERAHDCRDYYQNDQPEKRLPGGGVSCVTIANAREAIGEDCSSQLAAYVNQLEWKAVRAEADRIRSELLCSCGHPKHEGRVCGDPETGYANATCRCVGHEPEGGS